MKILNENLSDYYRTFEKVRVPKVAYYGSVYLDFENEYLFFQNEFTVVRLKLEFSLEEDEDSKENVFVFDGDKFFLLVAQYEYLIYDGDKFISPDGNNFKLSTFSEPYDPPELDPTEDWEKIEFTITPELLHHIRSASSYVPLDQESLRGLFFDNGQLIALQPQKFYQATVDVDNNFSLPFDFIKTLLSFDCVGESALYKQDQGDAHRFVFEQGDLSIRFVSSNDLALPVDIHSEEFISNYDHENYFVVDKSEFVSAIKFLDPFAKEVASSRVSLKFLPESSSLTIYVNDEQNIVDYKVDVHEYSSKNAFEGEELNISLSALSNMFSNIDSDLVYITFDSESPAMKFSSGSEADYFIIQTKIRID